MQLEIGWLSIILVGGGVILIYTAYRAFEGDEGFGAAACFIIACALLFWSYHEAQPETRTKRAAAEAARVADAAARKVPRVVREVDGCKVYAFEAEERWKYFTRCSDRTTTENSWIERSGKTSRVVTENIEVVEK